MQDPPQGLCAGDTRVRLVGDAGIQKRKSIYNTKLENKVYELSYPAF